MNPGEVLRKFRSKKGKDITLRVVKRSDWKDLMNLANGVFKEGDFIVWDGEITPKREKELLKKQVGGIKNKKGFAICAVEDNKIIGISDVERKTDKADHVGCLGIMINTKYRNEGIGKKLIKEVLDKSKKYLGLRIVILDYFETNRAAKRFYSKHGFKVYGKLPKGIFRKGRYITDIKMYKEL